MKLRVKSELSKEVRELAERYIIFILEIFSPISI